MLYDMTTTTAVPNCTGCQRPATHYRRYDLAMPKQGVVLESYRPTCDDCANVSKSALAAPRIPLSEVIA